MTDFQISYQPDGTAPVDTARPLRIEAGQHVFTRLLRLEDTGFSDELRVEPAPLAFWLIDNWWRLRWEGLPGRYNTAEWRQRHELTGIGGGYVWPRLQIWGDTDTIGLKCADDPMGVAGPVRFVTSAFTYLASEAFERGVDAFLEQACSDANLSSDQHVLAAHVKALREEREDPETTAWRKLEAQAGFDPDQAPEELVEDCKALVQQYGEQGVEEAIQAVPGTTAAAALRTTVDVAVVNGTSCDLQRIVASVGSVERRWGIAPWQLAEEKAEALRRDIGLGTEGLSNRTLAAVLGVDARWLDNTPNLRIPYGLRIRDGEQDRDLVVLRAHWSASRRFESLRALADRLWVGEDGVLGPMTQTRTSRQQFQNTFAQHMLCPAYALLDYIGTDRPDAEDFAAAARHFNVSEKVVKTALVNKAVISREQFEALVGE